LGFGTLLGAPFLALKRNPKATFGSALLIQAITVVISLLVIGAITFFFVARIGAAAPEDQEAIEAGGVAGILIGALVPFLITLIGTVFLQGVIVNEVARSTLGEKLTLKAVWKATWPRLGQLLLWVLVASLAFLLVLGAVVGIVWLLVVLGGGFVAAGIILAILAGIALVVVGVWLSIKLSIVPSIIVLERTSMAVAIRRSWRLTDGYFWRTLGVQYLIAFIVGTVSQIVLTPVSIFYVMAVTAIDPTGATAESWVGPIVLYVIMIVLSLLVGSITSVVSSAAIALIYVDLRMRKEGLDLELIRFVEARQSGNGAIEDPYLVPAAGRPAASTSPGGQPGSGSPWA
jgi:membrane-anchored glycerophosphoryl diester phosphodiesterase (GDPDase)